MKILEVISYFYPAWSYGGPGKLVYDLSNKLSRMNQYVTVLTTDAYSENRRRNNIKIPIILNLKLEIFKNLSNHLAFRFKLFLPVWAFFSINKNIHNYNIIHIHEFFTFFAVVISFFAAKNKIPYLISAHGTLDSFHLQNRLIIKKIFMNLFGNFMLRNAAGFIAATEEEIYEYQSLGIKKEKILYVQNGIDLEELTSLPKRGNFRKKYAIPDKIKLIIYLGRINKLKGLDLLLDAFQRLAVKVDCRLIIAGSDDGYLNEFKNEALTKKVLDKIIFPGILAGRKKLQAYADCSCFVYPSPAEGFSIAVLEAAATGLPLIITLGCKFPEVEQKKAGIIVPSDKNLLYQALLKLITDDQLRIRMGQNARTLIRQKYTIDVMAEKLVTYYRKIAA